MIEVRPARRHKPWNPAIVRCGRPDRRSVELEILSVDGGRARRRVAAPFTMPVEVANRIASRLAAEREKSHPEPSIRSTRLDIALAEHERSALARYIEDRSLLLGTLRSGNYGEGAGGTPGWNRAPMSEALRRAQERLAHIRRHSTPEERADLETFTRMMLPTDDGRPVTVEEFGRAICGSTEAKVCKGAFVGAMRKQAQRLHYLYQAWRKKRQINDKAS